MKRNDLIKLLRTLPEDREIEFNVNGDSTYFDRMETIEVVAFPTHDEEGKELKIKKIEKTKPVTTIHFAH